MQSFVKSTPFFTETLEIFTQQPTAARRNFASGGGRHFKLLIEHDFFALKHFCKNENQKNYIHGIADECNQ